MAYGYKVESIPRMVVSVEFSGVLIGETDKSYKVCLDEHFRPVSHGSTTTPVLPADCPFYWIPKKSVISFVLSRDNHFMMQIPEWLALERKILPGKGRRKAREKAAEWVEKNAVQVCCPAGIAPEYMEAPSK